MAAPLCNTTTLCDTTLLCNQDFPETVCRISFQGAGVPDPLTWVDFSSRLRSYEIAQGGENELELMDPGTATVVLDNRTRDLDPFNTSSAYSPNVKPRRRLWLQSYWAGECKDQFYGWTGSFLPGWVGNTDAVVTINAVDAFGALALERLPVPDPPRDTYQDVVLFDKPYLYLDCNDIPGSFSIKDSSENGRSSDDIFSGTIGSGDPVFGSAPIIAGDWGTSVSCANNGEFRWSDTGGTLDLTGSTSLAAELWLKGTSGPFVSVGSFFGIESTTAAPNNFQFQLGTDGATPSHVEARITTTSGKFTATGATALVLNTIYHLAMRWDGTNLKVYLNGVEDGTVAAGGSIKARDTAGPTGLRFNITPTGLTGHAAVYPTLSVSRLQAHYTAGTAKGRFVEAASTRIDELLNLSDGVAFVPRRIRSDTRQVQATYYHGQDAIEEINEAVRVAGDPSMFFFAKDGAAVFLDHSHRSVSPWDTVQATFDDDGTDFKYMDVTPDDGASFIRNDIRGHIRPWSTQGNLQQSTDSTSITEYGPGVHDLGETRHDTDANLATEITALLAKYKDPIARITAIQLHGSHNSGQVATQIYNRELGDKVRVFRRPVGGGSAIDQSSWIRKRVISGSHEERWPRATWALSSRGS